MKKAWGAALLVVGILVISFSIVALISVYNEFEALSGAGMGDYTYSFGKLLFPLLLTVLGRYIYRKGKAALRAN